MRFGVQQEHQDCSWNTSRNVATRNQSLVISDLYCVLPVRVARNRKASQRKHDQRILKDQGGLCSYQGADPAFHLGGIRVLKRPEHMGQNSSLSGTEHQYREKAFLGH